MTIRAVALNCSLKAKGKSSTELLLTQVCESLGEHDVEIDGPPIRVAALDVKPGVQSDEGDGDEWPSIRDRILEADILVLGTPIWMGQPSSVVKRVLERMDAFLAEEDESGRMISYDRVAMVAVVGNEDGAHHVCAELFQSLSDVGFTIPANGCTYWVGEAMGSVDYNDLETTPEVTADATASAATNAAHLARILKASPYPA